MKAVTKLYLSKEETTKIETMIDDIEKLLIEMSQKGISDCCSNAYDHLIKAQNQLQLFLDEIEESDEEEEKE